MRCKIFFSVRNAVQTAPKVPCISDHPKNPVNKQECFFDSKRSQSHVEMIVSFVLFVGFVIFLLLMFNPQKYNSLDYGSIDAVQASLMKNLSVEYDYTSVILTNATSLSGKCFKTEPIIGINGTIAVKDINGVVTYSRNESNILIIKTIDLQRFYGVYSADFFSELIPNQCSGLATIQIYKPKNYSLGILTTKSAVLYENIEELNRSYYSNYDGLKNNLGIKNDFSFIIRRNETDILFDTISKQPQNINVLSREIPFLSINKTGSTENLFMNLGVW